MKITYAGNRESLGKLSLYLFLVTLCNIFLMIPAFAASLDISLNKTKISTDEQIDITVTASGGRPSDPVFPAANDFEVSYRGSSSNVEIVNGSMSQSFAYTYTLVPRNTGKFTVGPVTAEIDGQQYTTRAVPIEVVGAGENRKPDQNSELFVTAQVNNLHPYLNEPVIYTFRFFRRVSTGNHQVKYPDFKGFWVEQLGHDREFEMVINNERYIVTEEKKALYPTETGLHTIEPTGFIVEYLFKEDDGFGGIFTQTRSELKRFTTNQIKLNVKPLPPGKPADFSGLVSPRASLAASMNETSAKVGDSLTLSLTLSGKGSVDEVKLPKLNLEGFKVYEDKPVVKSLMQGEDLITQKTFKFALIPLKSGKLKIPPLKISYFNTKTKRYQSVSSSPFNLKVDPSDEQETTSISQAEKKNDVNILGEDIFSIHDQLDSLNPQGLDIYKKILYLAWFLLPLIVYLLTYFFSSEKFRALANNKANARKNFKNYLTKINELEANVDKNGNEIPEKLSWIFRDYLVNKYNLNPQAVHPENLSREKLPGNLAREISDLFEKYEYLKFSGNSVSPEKKREILNSTKELLQRLESDKK
jgi:hypothetical protein